MRVVLLADDLIDAPRGGRMAQMAAHFDKYQCSILGVERVPPEETFKYGIVTPLPFAAHLSNVNVDSIVEAEARGGAVDLAVVGRYILTPRIFELLEKTPRGAGNGSSSPTRSRRCCSKSRC